MFATDMHANGCVGSYFTNSGRNTIRRTPGEHAVGPLKQENQDFKRREVTVMTKMSITACPSK